jgi:hypothetical protein
MGWKNVKEFYRIVHAVRVTSEGICIGSPYIHDLIVIGLDGIIKRTRENYFTNVDLRRYMSDFERDPKVLKDLVLSEDHFEKRIAVFTYDGGDVVEKFCEAPGWPNVTHDGQMMFDNTFSIDREIARQLAIRNAEAGVQIFTQRIKHKENELHKCEEELRQCENDLKKLHSSNGPS